MYKKLYHIILHVLLLHLRKLLRYRGGSFISSSLELDWFAMWVRYLLRGHDNKILSVVPVIFFLSFGGMSNLLPQMGRALLFE